MMNRELTPAQLKAMQFSAKLGMALIEDMGFLLVDFYIQGGTYGEAIDQFRILSKYGVSYRVAEGGIQKAISGHDGSLEVRAYEGLIPDSEERDRLSREHKSSNGRKTFLDGIGAHSLTIEQKRQAGRKGYEKTLANMNDGDVLANGSVRWSDEEILLAYKLSENKRRHSEIVAELNNRFHTSRTVGAMELKVRNYKKEFRRNGLNL